MPRKSAQKATHAGPSVLPDTEAVPCSSVQPVRANHTSVEEGGQPEFNASSGLCTEAKLPDSSDAPAAQHRAPEPAEGPIRSATMSGPQQSPVAVETRVDVSPPSANAQPEGHTETAQHFNQPMQWDAAASERLGSPADSVLCSPLLVEAYCKNAPVVRSTPDATVLVPPDASTVVRTIPGR